MSKEDEVVERARTWRRAQRTSQAAPNAEKTAARSAEFHALRKLGNAVDSLEKERADKPP